MSQPAWAATFTVNSTADAVDRTPGNGVCAAASGVTTGPASNEVRFVVGSVGCGETPNAPVLLPAEVDNGLVTLVWRPPTNSPVSRYAIVVGSAPGQADIGMFGVGPVTSFAARAGSGTYYVAVVATNDCGSSPPSNGIVVVVP